MINKPADLYGILTQIWRKEWALVKDEDEEEEPGQVLKEAERLIPELEDYAQAAGELEKIIFENLGSYLHLLNRRGCLKLAQRSKESNMDTLTASAVLPPILKMIQLRRVMGTEMDVDGQTVRIGQDIPPYEVMTVELIMSKLQQSTYLAFHDSLAAIWREGGMKTLGREGSI